MTPEEKVLTYSILSLVVLLVPHLPNENIENFVKSLGFIASIVLYSFAMVEIKKIKKNVYYNLSVGFLAVTSIFYALMIFSLITMLISAIAFIAFLIKG